MTLLASIPPLGLWMNRNLPEHALRGMARAAEDLGWGAVWISGGAAPGSLDVVRTALDATSTILMGPSIMNMWAESAREATTGFHAVEADHPGRLLLGVGPSHAPLVEQHNLGAYTSPLAKSEEYLAELAAQRDPVPADRILLSALGPGALRLAATRVAGTIPYLTVAEHTAFARATIGPDRFVAPELGVILTTDRDAGRDIARSFFARHLPLPNYTRTLLRHGMTPADLDDGGSDRLIDALFAIGSADDIVASIAAHRDAGADHVAIQVLALPNQEPIDVMSAITDASTSA